MRPSLILGETFKDHRGTIQFNNYFDMDPIKRIYTIQNIDKSYIRAWQGHKIEQRWFLAVLGEFKIKLIKIDDWENPSKNLKKQIFNLSDKSYQILQIPNGYVSSIQSLKDSSKLLVMSNYSVNEINDEYRYPINYF